MGYSYDELAGALDKPSAEAARKADGSYNSLWVPVSILSPRFATFSMTVDF